MAKSVEGDRNGSITPNCYEKAPESAESVIRRATPIAPDGDVCLHVTSPGGQSAVFKVASQVLCLASPTVFGAMLGPKSSFLEGQSHRAAADHGEIYVQTLPEEDSIEALEIILNAVHLQNDKVPHDVSFDTLIDLAVIADKYDIYAPIFYLIDTWAAPWEEYVLKAGYEEWLFIAWVFRKDAIFSEVSKKIILEGRLETLDGPLLTKEGRALEFHLPTSVTDAISKRRQGAIDALLAAPQKYFYRYHPRRSSSTILCKRDPPTSFCDTLNLGAIQHALSAVSLLPEDSATSRMRSIVDLVHCLAKDLKKHLYNAVRTEPCQTVPAATYVSWCTIHGDIYDCPGPIFHEECSFLPELIEDVDHVRKDLQGLRLGDFKSRGKPLMPTRSMSMDTAGEIRKRHDEGMARWKNTYGLWSLHV